MTDELVKRHVEQLRLTGGDLADLCQPIANAIEALTAERDKYECAWMTAEGKLEDAVQGLQKCQAELDEYSRQEYPLDHTVHERYRQRDYDANPARITLAALKGKSHD